MAIRHYLIHRDNPGVVGVDGRASTAVFGKARRRLRIETVESFKPIMPVGGYIMSTYWPPTEPSLPRSALLRCSRCRKRCLARSFGALVLAFLVKLDALSEEPHQPVFAWRHPGFSAHN